MGHTFGLEHPFGPNGIKQGSTRNIMDYGRTPDNRRFFFKYQIEQIVGIE